MIANGQAKPLLLSLQPKSVPKHFKRVSWSLCQHIFLISQLMLTPWEVMADQEDHIPENSLEFGNYVTRWFLMQGSDTFSPGDIRQCMETCLGSHNVCVREAVTDLYGGWRAGCCPHPIIQKTVPATKRDLTQNVNSAKTENFWGTLSLLDHKMKILLAAASLKYNRTNALIDWSSQDNHRTLLDIFLQHQYKLPYLYLYASKKHPTSLGIIHLQEITHLPEYLISSQSIGGFTSLECWKGPCDVCVYQ